MLPNWITTLIDDTNLFLRLYSLCQVSFESLFIFLLIGILFVMIVCLERAQKVIIILLDAMSKNKCSKIVSLFEIQRDVLFRTILVQ